VEPVCRKCKIELNESNWPASYKRQRKYFCPTCYKDYRKFYGHGESYWASLLAVNSRQRDKENGRISDINTETVIRTFQEQRGLCFWTKIPMKISIKKKDLFQPSIDRLDFSKGYIEGNYVVCTLAANYARNNSTPEEFREWINAIRSIK
jgi:hypothetical protein